MALVAFGCNGEDAPRPASPLGETALCAMDDECESGRCDPIRGCVACLFDHDCAAGERCEARECREITPCERSADCADELRPVCDEASLTCVACLADADCPGSARCVAARCEPYEACVSAGDCAEGTCDIERGECVECVRNDDCSDGASCLANRCVTSCRSEADCSRATPICGAQGYCVECATHAHCPAVYHCASGRCELDVCEGAETRCSADHRAIDTCAASGSGFLPSPCGTAQSCSTDSGEPSCVDWTCVPESESCDKGARYLTLCSADGLSVARRIDCSESDEACVDGSCTPRACTPNEFSCEDGDLYRCLDDGTAIELERTCRDDEICRTAEEACIPLVCRPEQPVCDGEERRLCNDDGTGFTGNPERCKRDEACFDGACLPRICASDYECDGELSLECVDNGTRLVTVERCDSTGSQPSYCNPDSGHCEAVGCDPSQPLCFGELATVCADDGSGPAIGGVDCTLLEKACFGGNCASVVCTEDFVCDEGDLYRCEDNGTALRLQGECGRPALCDAEAGVCLTEVCTPGEPLCNGRTATTCDETGAGYEPRGTDCAAAGQGCFEGTCQPLICAPNEHFCVESDVWLCDSSGTRSTLSDDCDSGEHCVAEQGTCISNACSPNAPVCAGTVSTTCRADGSGPEVGGTDCAASGQACRLGACEALVCTPEQRFCAAGHVRLCNATGTGSGPYDDCQPAEYCDEAAPARCRADRCTANAAACSGERRAACNENGSGYSSVQTDCAASGLVCSLSGCASTATDILGDIELSAENPMSTLELVALEVLTPRSLLELEAHFAVPANTEIVWLVYESSESTGSYTKLLERRTTVSAGPAGYHGSGAIELGLESGSYYALGALIRGAHTEYWSSHSGVPASFAAVVGEARVDTDSVPAEIWMDAAFGSVPALRIRTGAFESL